MELKNKIQNLNYFYIDSQGIIFQVSHDGIDINKGYLLENARFLLPILLKHFPQESEFLDQEYLSYEDSEILYCFRYDKSNKFFISFSTKEESAELIFKQFTDNEDQILQVFPQMKKSSEIHKFDTFPKFETPDIPCLVGESKVQLKSVSLLNAQIQVESSFKEIKNQLFKLTVGSIKFEAPIINYTKISSHDYTIEFDFHTRDDYHLWRKLNLAMKIRSEK